VQPAIILLQFGDVVRKAQGFASWPCHYSTG